MASADTTRRRLAAMRLTAQRIGGRATSTPLDTVRWMLALQGQDLAGAKWSIGLRGAGGTERDVDAAFAAGEIVRSWPMRGTLHVVAAEDIGWMLDLTTPAAIASSAQRRAALGLELADAERARETVQRVLVDGRVLTRDATLEAIDAAGVSTAGQRGYHLLWYLAQTGTLVLGPTEGRQQTYALLDDWVPDRRRLDRDQALGELALRFFRSHGPASAADLARWAGLPMRDVRAGIATCGGRLVTLELDGATYHLGAETEADPATADAATADGPRVHLLPGFDEYVLGYKDRSAVLAPEHSAAIVPGGNGVFRPTIVADGEVVGTWRRVTRRGRDVVEPALFGPPPRWFGRALAAAVEAYASYLGSPVDLAS
ncbi:MAG TPA: winged helix DNA-binding domain-containing protein [Candidatus Limnocylindrales bacterium]|nr:winged helix DNA-binding domain-containing protein [Candidatus Limnocylindrales bacterium]